MDVCLFLSFFLLLSLCAETVARWALSLTDSRQPTPLSTTYQAPRPYNSRVPVVSLKSHPSRCMLRAAACHALDQYAILPCFTKESN